MSRRTGYSTSDFEDAMQTASAVIDALGNEAHEWVLKELACLRKENGELRARLAPAESERAP